MHLQASWVEMDERHGELLQQVKSLKASLRRAGAHDEDAYQHDVQDYKKSPELFDRYGDPVRPAESLKAMWPEIGLPPPTDPRLVKCVIHLNMAPEELAFHVEVDDAFDQARISWWRQAGLGPHCLQTLCRSHRVSMAVKQFRGLFVVLYIVLAESTTLSPHTHL